MCYDAISYLIKLIEVQTEKLIRFTTVCNNTMVSYTNSIKQRAKGRGEAIPSGTFLTWRSRVSAIKPRTEPFDNGLQTRLYMYGLCMCSSVVFAKVRVCACIRESCWRPSAVERIIKREIIRLLPRWKSLYEMRNRGQRVNAIAKRGGMFRRSINFSIDTFNDAVVFLQNYPLKTMRLYKYHIHSSQNITNSNKIQCFSFDFKRI